MSFYLDNVVEESSNNPKILIVEDETVIAMQLKADLLTLGYRVSGILETGEEAVAAICEQKPDIALMDIRIRGPIDGIAAAEKIRTHSDIPIIFMTAYADESMLDRAMEIEPSAYLIKPFSNRELQSAIRIASYKAKTERQLKASEERYRVLAENVAEGVSIIWEGKLVFANKKFSDLFKIPFEELAAMDLASLFEENFQI